jgi:hypothetical protein
MNGVTQELSSQDVVNPIDVLSPRELEKSIGDLEELFFPGNNPLPEKRTDEQIVDGLPSVIKDKLLSEKKYCQLYRLWVEDNKDQITEEIHTKDTSRTFRGSHISDGELFYYLVTGEISKFSIWQSDSQFVLQLSGSGQSINTIERTLLGKQHVLPFHRISLSGNFYRRFQFPREDMQQLSAPVITCDNQSESMKHEYGHYIYSLLTGFDDKGKIGLLAQPEYLALLENLQFLGVNQSKDNFEQTIESITYEFLPYVYALAQDELFASAFDAQGHMPRKLSSLQNRDVGTIITNYDFLAQIRRRAGVFGVPEVEEVFNRVYKVYFDQIHASLWAAHSAKKHMVREKYYSALIKTPLQHWPSFFNAQLK